MYCKYEASTSQHWILAPGQHSTAVTMGKYHHWSVVRPFKTGERGERWNWARGGQPKEKIWSGREARMLAVSATKS